MGTTPRRLPSSLDSHKNRWKFLFLELWDYSAGGVGFVRPFEAMRFVEDCGYGMKKPFLPRAHAFRLVPRQVTSRTWNALALLGLHRSRGVKGRRRLAH